jgi:hypothetical protein
LRSSEKIKLIADRVEKKMEEIIGNTVSKNGEICFLKDFPMRYEEDGRVVSFSPIVGRVVIMNPTLGIIIQILNRYRCINCEDLFSNFLQELKMVGMRPPSKLQEDLSYALRFLFSHGYINIKIEEKLFNIIDIVQEAMVIS